MKPLIIVHHVPKTAGSSLRVALRENLGAERVYWHVADGNIHSDLPQLLQREDSLAVVGGHFGYEVADRFNFKRPLLRVSMVREPMDLLMSAINYVTKRPDHPQYTDVAPDSPAFLDTPLFKRYSQAQCWTMASRREAAKAIARLNEAPYLVSTSAEIDRLFERIMEVVGEPVVSAVGRLNVGSKQYDWFDKERAARQFSDGLAEDRKLFRYITDDCNGFLDTTSRAA